MLARVPSTPLWGPPFFSPLPAFRVHVAQGESHLDADRRAIHNCWMLSDLTPSASESREKISQFPRGGRNWT